MEKMRNAHKVSSTNRTKRLSLRELGVEKMMIK
jgi:hypothetical protein